MKALILSLILIGFEMAYGDCTPVYSVPISNPELAAVSNFKINSYLVIESATRVQVQYEMPAELVGEKKMVSFKGLKTDGALIGDEGMMVCTTEGCLVRFENLKIDQSKAASIIKDISKSEKEIKQRMSVLSSFAADPGGTFTYSADCESK